MKKHPLERAYRKYIRKKYGSSGGRVTRAEERANNIKPLGLSYSQYVEVACRLLHSWAEEQDWEYPYWNAITSDGTIQRVRELLGIVDKLGVNDSYNSRFLLELTYATAYVSWFIGETSTRPVRIVDAESDVRIEVAEYLCDMYGVECKSSNYNNIAIDINRSIKLG